jgi:hypothetical protein
LGKGEGKVATKGRGESEKGPLRGKGKGSRGKGERGKWKVPQVARVETTKGQALAKSPQDRRYRSKIHGSAVEKVYYSYGATTQKITIVCTKK